MNYKIKIVDKEVDFIVKNRKYSRQLKLVRYGDGSLVIIKPKNLSWRYLKKFFYENSAKFSNWIDKFDDNSVPAWLKNSRPDYLKNKNKAKIFIYHKLKYWNQFYHFNYNKITVRNSLTRWGSCSTKKNLNFNYKLIYLPEAMADYIIVHELCHLAEFNHSQKFWQFVGKTQPNYKEIKRKLRNKLF